MEHRRVWTIGHSNHPLERLLDLLRGHAIEVVADVRSSPYSQYAPQFDLDALGKALREAGIRHVYLGRELGGRPRGDRYYDERGHVLYGEVAKSEIFLAGIARLETGMERYRVALLCAEENPAACHRRLLVGRLLAGRGAEVLHIRGDATVVSEAELAAGETEDQMLLFQEMEAAEWKSIPLVSPKKRQNSSSGF
jgi:uncharacterized protein (DUF488 family)